ncbi:MAG TPA: hypothetical protein V6D50_07605 [Chroococcales cyanobacterium]
MLVTAQIEKTPSVERLVQLWGERYTPDLSSLSSAQNEWAALEELLQAALPFSRAVTAIKLQERLIQIRCQMAGIQTKSLYAYIPNIVSLTAAERLNYFAFLVYKQVIELYPHSSLTPNSHTTTSLKVGSDAQRDPCLSLGMAPIDELAQALEPVLLDYQEQYIESKDWRTLGFITTLLNFSSKLMLETLTLSEQILITPYFKFIEEQVAIPWQRVCAAAASHQLGSPVFTLVEQMLPQSQEIAETVYRRLVHCHPQHRSRRGGLSHPGIRHSTIRDLEMFQAYLWLCVLEDSVVSVEQELVELCVMVMTGVGVSWELIQQFIQVLLDEVLDRVSSEQKCLLLPYTQEMLKAFKKEQVRFEDSAQHSQSSSSGKSVFPRDTAFFSPIS